MNESKDQTLLERKVLEDRAKKGDRKSHPLLFVVVFVLLIAFGFQGTRHLWQPDEGYNAEVTLEMLDSGNLLDQTLNHQLYLGKPPMYIWGSLPGVILFGKNEFGMRAFSAVSFALTVFFTGLLGTKIWSQREGVLSGLIFATMVLPVAAGNIGRPDASLALATSAATFCFWMSAMPGARNVALWKMAMCAAFGFGFMIKATGTLVPAAPMFCYLLLTRQTLRYFLTPWAPICVLIFGTIGCSWFFYTAYTFKGTGAFMWDSMVTGRLVTDDYQRNPNFLSGFVVYGPPLLGGAMPWIAAWIPLVLKRPSRASLRAMRNQHEINFLVLLIVLPLIVYFSARSKLPLYVLPVFSPFALLTARALTQFMPLTFASDYPSKRVWAWLCVWGIVLLGLKAGAAFFPTKKDEGALWLAMRDKVPPACSRIFIVDEDLNGLAIYSGREVIRVGEKEVNDTFSLPPPLDILKTLDPGKGPYAIVTKLLRNTSSRDRVRQYLRNGHLRFEEYPLPYGRTLTVCSGTTTN